MQDSRWLEWAVELQSIAQAGLYYGKDVFDIQRFERVREIAAEMVAEGSGLPVDKVKDLFCCETGYQTPKIGCRGAIFKGDKILLVQESDGRWTLPGGWVDVYSSVKEGMEKEAWEEAGLKVTAERLIALLDWKKYCIPPRAYGICTVFFLCKAIGGEFRENIETLAADYFSMDELPPLDEGKTTREHIEMCFEAKDAENWEPLFD